MHFLFDMIGLYVLILCFGAVISIFTFVKDVSKWHRAEKKVKITPSADLIKESEVNIVERDNPDSPVNDSANDGQSDSSVIFSSWL